MNKQEKARRISERAGVSIVEAEQALDICNGDMLESVVYLEAAGKVHPANYGSYNNAAFQNMASEKNNYSGTYYSGVDTRAYDNAAGMEGFAGNVRSFTNSYSGNTYYSGSYSTGTGTQYSEEFRQAQNAYAKECKSGNDFGETMGKVASFIGGLIAKAWSIKFCVSRKDEEMFKLPLLILIIMAISVFWLTGILLVVGLFCECRYRFEGTESHDEKLNSFCDRASSTCDDIKREFNK